MDKTLPIGNCKVRISSTNSFQVIGRDIENNLWEFELILYRAVLHFKEKHRDANFDKRCKLGFKLHLFLNYFKQSKHCE
uniref:Uncharacterized protein n=1 Tax=Rhizophora mucronata TaxID=61149 RepID=A0A2P2KRY5_RHIMU